MNAHAIISQGLACKSLSAAAGWTDLAWPVAYLPEAHLASAFASHKAYLTAGFVGKV